MTKKQALKIEKLLASIDIGVYADDIKNIDTVDDLREYLQDQNYFDVEIIYYSNAIEYLFKNDPSLQISCGLAHELGYTTDNLNSELLASLLASENTREAFEEIVNDIDDILV